MKTFALVLVVILTGCASNRAAEIASRQHNCPRDRVHVLRNSGGYSYVLDVCGSRRVYQLCQGPGGMFDDVTNTLSASSGGHAPSASAATSAPMVGVGDASPVLALDAEYAHASTWFEGADTQGAGEGWAYSEATDPMRPGTILQAALWASEPVTLGTEVRPRLAVASHPQHGTVVALIVHGTQLDCQANACNLLIRTDEGTPAPTRFAATNVTGIYVAQLGRVVEQRIRSAGRWRIQLNAGGHVAVADFAVGGYDPARLVRP